MRHQIKGNGADVRARNRNDLVIEFHIDQHSCKFLFVVGDEEDSGCVKIIMNES